MTKDPAAPFATYRNGELWLDGVPAEAIAGRWGTPCYVYSRRLLEQEYDAFDRAFAAHPHRVCFAVKANSNLTVLRLLANRGAGFDVVSAGELQRVLQVGGDGRATIFSGVGKSREEMAFALQNQILCFNVESAAELERLAEVAATMGIKAPLALRVNPDVDAHSHPYISTGLSENKFGIDIRQALELYQQAHAHPHLQVRGIACHIGSQLTELAPLREAYQIVLALVEQLEQAGITLAHIDLGGGFGIAYRNESPPPPAGWIRNLLEVCGHRRETLLIEPGRAIAAKAGVLLTRVEYLKHNGAKGFIVVDAAMNDLIRPALYQAWHDIVPALESRARESSTTHDVVGPICETGDFLGKDRHLSAQPGDLLAVLDTGAYGFTMSSNYNSRPRPAEVLVEVAGPLLIRSRETLMQLLENELLPGLDGL